MLLTVAAAAQCIAQQSIPDDITFLQEPVNGRMLLAILRHEDPFCLHDALNTYRARGIELHLERSPGEVEIWVKVADYERASQIMPQMVTWPYWDVTMRYLSQNMPPDRGAFTTGPAGLLDFVLHIPGIANWQKVNLKREVQSLKQVEWSVRPFSGPDGKVKTGVDVALRNERHVFILPGQKAPIPPPESPIHPNLTARQAADQIRRACRSFQPAVWSSRNSIRNRLNEASKLLFSLRNCDEDVIAGTCALLDERAEDFDLYPFMRVWLLLQYELPRRKLSTDEFGKWHWPLVLYDDQEYQHGYPWLKGDDGGWMLGEFTWRIEGGHLGFRAMHLLYKGLPRRTWTKRDHLVTPEEPQGAGTIIPHPRRTEFHAAFAASLSAMTFLLNSIAL